MTEAKMTRRKMLSGAVAAGGAMTAGTVAANAPDQAITDPPDWSRFLGPGQSTPSAERKTLFPLSAANVPPP